MRPLLAEAAVAAAMDHGLIRKAAAIRAKYRVSNETISPCRMAVHPQNRGGVYPQPDTVRNLGLNIMAKGFSQREANHEGVCVEEMPYSERTKHSRSDGSAYEPYADYNMRQRAHRYLDTCFSTSQDIMFGTLSHSHLLLVLLSWANGAEWTLEDEPNLSKLLNPDGNYVQQCRSCGM